MKEKKQKLIDITTVKFLLVGVINTLVGTGTMFGLYELSWMQLLGIKCRKLYSGQHCELFSEQVFYF